MIKLKEPVWLQIIWKAVRDMRSTHRIRKGSLWYLKKYHCFISKGSSSDFHVFVFKYRGGGTYGILGKVAQNLHKACHRSHLG